jgi:hypothetical protein
VRGIRWVPGLLGLRGLLGPLDVVAARHPRLEAACRMVESEAGAAPGGGRRGPSSPRRPQAEGGRPIAPRTMDVR